MFSITVHYIVTTITTQSDVRSTSQNLIEKPVILVGNDITKLHYVLQKLLMIQRITRPKSEQYIWEIPESRGKT